MKNPITKLTLIPIFVVLFAMSAFPQTPTSLSETFWQAGPKDYFIENYRFDFKDDRHVELSVTRDSSGERWIGIYTVTSGTFVAVFDQYLKGAPITTDRAIAIDFDHPGAVHVPASLRVTGEFGGKDKYGNVVLTAKSTEKYPDLSSSSLKYSKKDEFWFARRGDDAIQSKRFHLAIKSFDGAIGLSPNFDKHRRRRCVANQALKKYEDALRDCSKAIELSKLNHENFGERGNTYFAMSRFSDAERDFSTAIRLSSDDVNWYFRRALTYEKMGKRSDAVRDLKRVLAIDPDTADVVTPVLQRLGS